MKNFIQEGKHINVTLTANVGAGEAGLYGSIFGVHVNKGLSGEVCPLVTEGIVELPKDASVVSGLGQDIHWDNTAKRATTTRDGNMLIGEAVEGALSGDSTVKLKLGSSKTVSPAANQADNATANAIDAATTQTLANSLKTDFNALLAKLKAAGVMIAD
jgi:predicted RecA/RadA family phage recombinase